MVEIDYVDELRTAFSKISTLAMKRCGAFADTPVGAPALTSEKTADGVTLTLDTRELPHFNMDKGAELATSAIATALRDQDLEVHSTNQFGRKRSMSDTGVFTEGGGFVRFGDNINYPKLVFTVPATGKSVEKLADAHQAMVVEIAAGHIDAAHKFVADQLGERRAGPAWEQVMESAGKSATASLFL